MGIFKSCILLFLQPKKKKKKKLREWPELSIMMINVYKHVVTIVTKTHALLEMAMQEVDHCVQLVWPVWTVHVLLPPFPSPPLVCPLPVCDATGEEDKRLAT